MKKWFLLLVIPIFILGANYAKHKENYYYWHTSSVTNDAVLLDNIFGNITAVHVCPTGTDTAFDISFYLDPPELGDTTDPNQILLTTISDVNALGGNFYYVLQSQDQSGNTYGGIPVSGAVYIKITNANSTTLTDIKVWIVE